MRTKDDYDRMELEEKVVSAAEQLISSRCHKDALSRDEMEDLRQELRIAVVQALRSWDPSHGVQFFPYLSAVLDIAEKRFLCSNSVLGAHAERRFARGELQGWERRQADMLRGRISLDLVDPFAVDENTPDLEQKEREQQLNRLYTCLVRELDGDVDLAEAIFCLIENQSLRQTRARIHSSWSRAKNLLDKAEEILDRWKQSPPDWLLDVLNNL